VFLGKWSDERGTVLPPRHTKPQFDAIMSGYLWQRNVIERIFCRFRGWLRVAMHFGLKIERFMGTIALAAIDIYCFIESGF
jgi:hypothetical protein